MMTGIDGGGTRNEDEWEGHLPEDDALDTDIPLSTEGYESSAERLSLGEEERLPWLESADDVDLEEESAGAGRLIGFVVIGLITLAAIVGGIFWATHRGATAGDADGSLIEASKEPYKVAPAAPGGKTFAGTGDSSFKVSEGEHPQATIATKGEVAAPATKPSAATSGTAAKPVAATAAAPADTGGIGVQVGAFSSSASAQAAWGKLSGQYEALKGMNHRVVEAKADVGTVYRLQAVAGDVGAANTLCAKLQAGGLKCQVKK
jgi:nitrogen fixation-related uncharacterized protein